LVEGTSGRRLPGALLPSLGLALIIVAVYLVTGFELGAQVAPAVPILLAVTGFAIGWRRLLGAQPDRVAIAVAVAVFLILSLSVVPGGEATWTGYYRLNDSLVHFSVVEWVFEHSRTPPEAFESTSAYLATVRNYLEAGYPIGAHMPLGAMRALVGADTPWLIPPYLAFLLALTAAGIHSLLEPVRPMAMRALAASLAVLSGLVTAYFVAGNIKEIAALWAMVTAAAVAVSLVRPAPGLRAALAFVVVLLAGFFILNLAIGPWLLPAAAVVGFAGVRDWTRRGWRESAPEVAVVGTVATLAIVLSLSAIDRFVAAAEGVLTDAGDLGNLAQPVSLLEAFGIWPLADYRFPLDEHAEIGTILIGIAIVAFVLGAVSLIRDRVAGGLLLLASALLAGTILGIRGSPYADAKTLMIVSPAIVMTAAIGAAALHNAERRIEAWLLVGALAFGVFWTDALRLASPAPAPRARYAELAQISEHAPKGEHTYFNGWDEFFAYFGRDSSPEGPPYLTSETRENLALREGERARYPFDMDELTATFAQSWSSLVLSRSPLASRPPSNFDPVVFGEYYELWRRDRAPGFSVLEHHPLGNPFTPAGIPSCGWVRRLGRRAERHDARLAYYERPPISRFIPTRDRPPTWDGAPAPATLIPLGAGTISGNLKARHPGIYNVWLEAQLDRDVTIQIGGKKLTLGKEFGPPGQFLRAGRVDLARGRHRFRLHAEGNGPFDPPTEGRIGPIVLAPADVGFAVGSVSAEQADELCGRRLDWIELIGTA
jgi:hypothetical protein